MRSAVTIMSTIASLFIAQVAMAKRPVRSVALTFDDLPYANASSSNAGTERDAALNANRRVQDALRRHSAPAIGFVNELRVQQLGDTGLVILRSWNRGSFELGNHGFAHADSNELTLPQVAEEISSGEATIKPLMEGAGRSLRFYRFPFNHVGDPEDRRLHIELLLASRGYKLAASTIDTSDYVFAKAYERAIAQKDAAKQKEIENAYLHYTRQQVEYYGKLNLKALGYQPPEIMLLHLNSLNAAVMESILEMFEALNYRFVTLEEAQSDPAYQRMPSVATKYGPMWGYRWARERNVKVDGSLEKDPPQWVSSYAGGR